jgi:sec-independent protein translocase protein TatB
MFDINWSELVVIGVVALIVIGPKELPAVLRGIGQWTTKIRRMAGEFQSQFQEAMREAEMADLKKQVNELGDAAKGVASDFGSLDFSEATKWEPKSDSKPEQPSPAASETAEIAAVAAPAETEHGAAAEHAGVPSAAPAENPPPTPSSDAPSTAEPQPAVPLGEGSGRA